MILVHRGTRGGNSILVLGVPFWKNRGEVRSIFIIYPIRGCGKIFQRGFGPPRVSNVFSTLLCVFKEGPRDGYHFGYRENIFGLNGTPGP